jgi:general secretion pathway protein J
MTHRGRAACRGFSLLEILLAVTIMALVVTVVYGTWNTAFMAWKRSTDVTESLHRQRIVMDSLVEMTSSAVYFGGDAKTYGVLGDDNSGMGAKISFVTASEAALPPSEAELRGLRRVTLKLATDDEGKPYLAISNDLATGLPLGENEEVWHTLSRDVTEFAVRYQDARDQAWYDSWREDLTLPMAIEYTVTFAPSDDRSDPLTLVRRVELATADYALRSKGKRPEAGTGTNAPSGVPPRVNPDGGR